MRAKVRSNKKMMVRRRAFHTDGSVSSWQLLDLGTSRPPSVDIPLRDDFSPIAKRVNPKSHWHLTATFDELKTSYRFSWNIGYNDCPEGKLGSQLPKFVLRTPSSLDSVGYNLTRSPIRSFAESSHRREGSFYGTNLWGEKT
jgi:hypothetical protein